MVDTARTLTDLLSNLFQDGQSAGDISENDVRDLIVSLASAQGGYARNALAATTIVTPGTYVKAAGTTSSHMLYEMTSGIDNRLVYTGTPNRNFLFWGTMSMTTASNNQVVGAKFAKNGVVDDDSVVRRKVGTGADIGAIPILGSFELATNDYVELWVTNETSATTVTLDEFHVHGEGRILTA